MSDLSTEVRARCGMPQCTCTDFRAADRIDELEAHRDESIVLIAMANDRVNALEAAIRKHRDQRGDDRCWLDDRELYAVLPEGLDGADLRLPPPDEMLSHCRRYIATRHDPAQEYVSPQRTIEAAQADKRAAMERVRDACRELIPYPTTSLFKEMLGDVVEAIADLDLDALELGAEHPRKPR